MRQRTGVLYRALAPIVYVAAFALYIWTLAPSVVFGDPGEYQVVPHVLGIAHPPGYAFFTILAKLWTSIVRVGSIAYRSNLLAAAGGAWTVLMVYEMVLLLWVPFSRTERESSSGSNPSNSEPVAELPQPAPSVLPVFAGLLAATFLAVSTDLWQHSIHANAHIISAALSATTLYTGLRWWATGLDRWLVIFGFLSALGVTHHPLLAVGAPSFLLFAIAVRPGLLRDWRRIGIIVMAMLLGFSVFLYLPLRAGATSFGPAPDLDSILGHATARGIRGNLFQFSLADQLVRLQVFLELLLLQFTPLVLVLSLVGVVWLARRRRRAFVLLAPYYVFNLAFTINTVQDVMAYLLLPFMVTALLAGVGVLAVFHEGRRVVNDTLWQGLTVAGVVTVLAIAPIASALAKTPRISLRSYRLADEYIEAVFEEFAGKGEGAVLLAPWEGMTPLLYAQHVEGRRLDSADVKLVFVASGTANPWVEFVWKHIEDGPIYLADYRPQVVAEGFRLRPVGAWPLFRLEAPPATQMPDVSNPLDLWAGDAIHILGWDLDRTALRVGETAYLTLFMSAPRELTDYYMPYLRLGKRLYRWTTDTRLNTPWWEPNEIIVERFGITIPFGTEPGAYPLNLGVSNVSRGEDLMLSSGASLTALPPLLRVEPAAIAPPGETLTEALANINSRVVLFGGRASARHQTAKTPWAEPLRVQPGDEIHVWLDWRVLATADQPYTFFVHLIDGAGRPRAQHDYTPMGGAFPSYLWIPRWIEGQRFSDPYTLAIPFDAPAGDYLIEIGMYHMTSQRRAYHFDPAGNLAGDRFIMGPVRVEVP